MHLVNIQMCAALFHEVVSKVGKTVIGKINVVGSNIQTVVVRSVLDALQYHCRFADTSWSEYAYHTRIPVYLIVFVADKLQWCLLEQLTHIGVKI